jgi:hypothetical protein
MIIISISNSNIFYSLDDRMINVPGEDAITAKLIREGCRYFWRNIYKLIVSVWQKEALAEE